MLHLRLTVVLYASWRTTGRGGTATRFTRENFEAHVRLFLSNGFLALPRV